MQLQLTDVQYNLVEDLIQSEIQSYSPDCKTLLTEIRFLSLNAEDRSREFLVHTAVVDWSEQLLWGQIPKKYYREELLVVLRWREEVQFQSWGEVVSITINPRKDQAIDWGDPGVNIDLLNYVIDRLDGESLLDHLVDWYGVDIEEVLSRELYKQDVSPTWHNYLENIITERCVESDSEEEGQKVVKDFNLVIEFGDNERAIASNGNSVALDGLLIASPQGLSRGPMETIALQGRFGRAIDMLAASKFSVYAVKGSVNHAKLARAILVQGITTDDAERILKGVKLGFRELSLLGGQVSYPMLMITRE